MTNWYITWKKNIFRLCIFSNCEQNVFKLTHDDCFHTEHHRAYVRLINVVYVHKLFKKFTIYIRHCSVCQLNQIKRHRFNDELTSLFISSIFFHTLIMNWVIVFSNNKNEYDCILNVICKFNRKFQFIHDKTTYFVVKWIILFIDRLQFIDWNISLIIIFDRDSKFLFEFWTVFFERLNTNLFFNFAYHSQIDEQSKRTNQIFEIILRYFITKHSDLNWVDVLSKSYTSSLSTSSQSISSQSIPPQSISLQQFSSLRKKILIRKLNNNWRKSNRRVFVIAQKSQMSFFTSMLNSKSCMTRVMYFCYSSRMKKHIFVYITSIFYQTNSIESCSINDAIFFWYKNASIV